MYQNCDVSRLNADADIREANINSGMNDLQVHASLVADTRVKAYNARRGVL